MMTMTGDVESIRHELRLVTEQEDILDAEVERAVQDARIAASTALAGVAHVHTGVDTIRTRFEHILTVLTDTATLADSVSTAVRDIDREKTSVRAVIMLINDIQVVKQSAVGAKLAYDSQSVEDGARNISQYLAYSDEEIKRIANHIKLFDVSFLYGAEYSKFTELDQTITYDSSNNVVNGGPSKLSTSSSAQADTAATTTRVENGGGEATSDATTTTTTITKQKLEETSPLSALRNIEMYRKFFLERNGELFDEAILKADDSKILHHFLIFIQLGYKDIGLDRFSAYICSQLEQQSRSIVRQRLTASILQPNTFALLMTQVFETVATIIDQQEQFVENNCGIGSPIYLLQRLQKQADSQAIQIMDSFMKHYELQRKITEISQFDSQVKNNPGFLASLTNVTGLSVDRRDTSEDRGKTSRLPAPIAPKVIDAILNELALMSSKVKVFIRFLAIRSVEYIESYYEEVESIKAHNEKIISPHQHRSSFVTFSADEIVDDIARRDSSSSMMSTKSTTNLAAGYSSEGRIKPIPELREVKGSGSPAKLVISKQLKDLFVGYIAMESYFLKQNIWRAMEQDSIDTGTGMTSTSLDDVFYIIRTSTRRCLMTADCNFICAMIEAIGRMIVSEFMEVFQTRIKTELSKLRGILENLAGNTSLAAALGTVEGLTATSTSVTGPGGVPSEGTLLDPNYSTKMPWVIWLNNMDICCDYLSSLISEVDNETVTIFGAHGVASVNGAIKTIEAHQRGELVMNASKITTNDSNGGVVTTSSNGGDANTNQKLVSSTGLSKSPERDTNAMAIEMIRACLDALKDCSSGFRKSSKTWIDNVFRQQVKPRLRTILPACYERVSYMITEEEYLDAKLSERFSKRLIVSLRGVIEPCSNRLTPWNLRQMVADIADFICKEWERILSSFKFSPSGALRFKKDVEIACNYLAQASTADTWVRNRFSNLIEFAEQRCKDNKA